MAAAVKNVRTTGMVISKPVAFVLVLIYMIQSVALLYLIYDKYENERLIYRQQAQIKELKEKLVIQDILRDLQSDLGAGETRRLANSVYSESKKYGYDPLFILALIKVESSFKKRAVSNKGAMGYMQMKPSTGWDLAQRGDIAWEDKYSLFRSDYNLHLGTLYLSELIFKFKNLKHAIIAYNLGETETRRRLIADEPLPKNYVDRVLDTYHEFREKYAG
ncbi:MAG: lytic transglycosylase domain-containing protein [candidate division Zixibacteria bacterium]|nr:lytic transglycosylase domain-containing protein [candidate division Zixibacteria bacterium]NIR65867.1 lytic transglycosylase domain-containing protein [candidate division Zixibacteria bacterium]NIS16505.1 lytic transglycosylase domain-containing protein [candidate division Zixibacteria bacterium]NIS47521.1 lytic transglycosylase domain-containing protein [candidate division Zixibacteria bacterium]NIT52878.1 lytic transglycosylase domain-containing protein [candidate division Zixibacteria ba